MEKKDGAGDLSDLEKEIDSTVDTLLVEKKARSNPAPLPPKTLSPAQEAHIVDKPTLTPNPPPARSPAQTSAFQAQQMRPVSRDLREKLESVEAQLLTLEWDISSKHINDAITHLQDLRRLSPAGEELEKVIILIQKVLHQLILDENKLTPSALKFLQKSWKAVKGMTDERFSFEIDKKTLVQELMTAFQKLKIEGVPQERGEMKETLRPLEEHTTPLEERVLQKPQVEAKIPVTKLDTFMNKLEKLERIINEERKRWESIQQEISIFKADMQRSLRSGEKFQEGSLATEIGGLDENREGEPHRPSYLELDQDLGRPTVAVSLVTVSGIVFGIPEKQIIRSFPIKRWVAEFFIERGKVKLKSREIPLFNMLQVFKLKPSTEENPQVILLRGREDHPAAIIVDAAIAREEIEYQRTEGKPYLVGQGISKSGRVWILDAEQISP